MTHNKPFRRWALRLLLWAVGIVLVVFGIQVGLLAFPQVVLANRAEAGSVIVFYRGAHDPAVQELANRTDHRLRAGGFGDIEKPERVFFFRDQSLYSLFARLARVPPEAQGFGISFLGTGYVSGPRVEALGTRTGHAPGYSVWEGDVSHTVAHEVAHLIMIDSIGRRAWLNLPQWKQEGFPEYVANIGLLREDPTASLLNRIEILQDDRRWLGHRSWDRIHYEAGLLVEFLLDIRGMSFREIMADSVLEENARNAMLSFYQERAPAEPPSRLLPAESHSSLSPAHPYSSLPPAN